MKTQYELLQEYEAVKTYRENLEKEFCKKGHSVQVLIGGSFALRCLLKSFSDRQNHDYDFIVTGDVEYAKEVLQRWIALGTAKRIGYPNYHNTSNVYRFTGRCFDKEVDIILSPHSCASEEFGRIFNSPINICNAKWKYITERKKKGLTPRIKDVRDVYYIYKVMGVLDIVVPALNKKKLSKIMEIAREAGLLQEPAEYVLPLISLMI